VYIVYFNSRYIVGLYFQCVRATNFRGRLFAYLFPPRALEVIR